MLSLDPDEPPPAVPFNPEGRSPIVICCDHAGRAIPRRLGDLGVPAAEIERHIGWDIGALDVATRLAAILDAPGVAAPYSRLVIDCNRRPETPGAMPVESDGTPIPGNCGLTAEQRAQRIETLHRPYHAALKALLKQAAKKRPKPILVSVHSFTPVMAGKERPWQIGVLWRHDQSISAPLLAALTARGDFEIGDNQPYSGFGGFGFTIPHHAEAQGLPHVMLEIRQNEIDTPERATRYAEAIGAALRPILMDRL